MIDRKKLIEALRCSARPGAECRIADCPYRVLEEISDDYLVPPDVVKDGVGYWKSCHVDQMARDAADMLEGMS